MSRYNAVAMGTGIILVLSACGTGASTGTAGTPGSGSSGSPTPTLTRSVDYETFDSVAAITKTAQLVVMGTVVGEPEPADRASQKGGDPNNDTPSVVFKVRVEKTYKGSSAKEILVIQPDPTRIKTEPRTPLAADQQAVLFLNDPGVTFKGLSVHATYGNDQGYVSLNGDTGRARPATHLDPLPLPATLGDLETQITAAAR